MGGKPLEQRSFDNVASIVRRAIAAGNYMLWFKEPHAFDRMWERDIDADDVLTALRSCRVINRELRGQWRYTAQGKVFDGREICVVLEIYTEEVGVGLLVVTVWSVG